ncbi:DUF4129 domain-containing protein [Gordonia jinghuaiqii]|uniref:DUF4129 domain-containing protein n=1 Tax=Gordonia jinghuaiqii TaxID=2758710 RepID=UPI001FD3E1B3|nr:DUF4129 domain-containing protein [Gordonia jinghuaiqii]
MSESPHDRAVTPVLAAPLDPGNDEARQWAERELSEPEYQPPEPSWLDRLVERFWNWVGENIFDWFGGSDTVRAIVLVLAIALVLSLIVVVVRHVRRNPRAPGTPGGTRSEKVLQGTPRTADELRSEAENDYAAGDYNASVIAAVRALARRSIERELLADVPSLTAHEVAVNLSPRFPSSSTALREATDLFDAIAYGDRYASAGSARAVLDLERAVASARPAEVGSSHRRLAVPR